MRISRSAILSGLLATAAVLGSAAAQEPIRIAPHADLKSFDPVWNTAAITISHSLMVYDSLFGMDSQLRPKPQMVESFSSSADGLKHSFVLRAGMKYHDGTPVTAKDAVASLQRWGKRWVEGRALLERTASLAATGDLSFEFTLKEPFGPIFDVIANPVGPMFVMREKDALTDPNTQITEAIGSGPFIFVREQWNPGNKVVYRKNPEYKSRAEPSDGLAGGKVPKVERVEWIVIPDANTAVQALLKAEVDAYEYPPIDLLPILKRDPNVVVKVFNKPGVHGMIRPNALHPPFNDPRARRALAMAVDQKAFLAAMIGNPDFEKECYAVFQCGTPNETDVATEPFRKRDLETAKRLLKESGYDGRPIVIMDPTDQQIIHNIAIMTAQTLKDIGANVDLQAMDWATLTTRRGRKDAPGPGSLGWNIFTTWSSAAIMHSPVTNFALQATCDGNNWFGWACDDEIERLRKVYIAATKDADRRKAIEDLQRRYYEVVPFVITGQFQSPIAYRKSLVGLPDSLLLTVWNTEKK